MNLVEFEFAETKREVEIYFVYLEKIDRDDSCLALQTGGAHVREPFGREFRTILKANALLLLYNLIESTVQRSIEGIADAVGRERASYFDASANLRQIWARALVKRLRRAAEDKWSKQLSSILDDCLKREVLQLNARELLKNYSGNIDADFVRILADDFGIALDARQESKGGVDLAQIKHSRNQLAHGVEKFTQVGGRMTVADLNEMKVRVICFLEDLIRSVDRYVTTKQFKVA